MSADAPDFRALEENLARYRELKSLIARIGEALDQRTATLAEVSDLLGQLGDRLVKHFAFEEDGGYFAEALTHAPQLVSKANALLAQHPKMWSRAKDLIVELDTRHKSGEDWWQHTAALFQTFRDELIRHERHENALLQEAYARDIGATD